MLRPAIPAFLVAVMFAGCVNDSPDEVVFPDPVDDPAAWEAPPVAWASLDNATVRPGVQMRSETGQCTSNFVYTNPAGTKIYLGFAAHCVANDGQAGGCNAEAEPLDLGSAVTIQGATQPAALVYTSWGTMLDVAEADGTICTYNDFAVVEIHPDDYALVNPAILHYGGPTAIAAAADAPPQTRVLSYGNSGLRPDGAPDQLDWKEGVVLETSGDGWTHTVFTATPGIPGDSGSNMITEDGKALGIVVTLEVAPRAGSNGVTDLAHALAYASEVGGIDFHLATWDVINPGVIPAAGLI